MIHRKKIETAILIVNFIFLIATLMFKERNTEYTPYSKFLLNSYMTVLLGICLLSGIFKINFISNHIGILNSGKGKGIVLLLVGLVYITGNSTILFVLGVVLLCSACSLIAMDTFLPSEKVSGNSQGDSINKSATNATGNTITPTENKEIDPSNPYDVPEDF